MPSSLRLQFPRLVGVILVTAFAGGRGDLARAQLSLDVGASSGSVNGVSVSEMNVGVNAQFAEFFTWRNSGFARFQTGTENVYGLDTSLRAGIDVGDEAMSFSAFAGPGWRFVSKGTSAPIVEGGLGFRTGGLHIGGGAKVIMNSVAVSGASNETQYFITLAGGTSL
jgi:hypothetical protein